jgi:alginate O-acetyltransferase complex protein AlgI
MLFNSYVFVLLFLPLALAVFHYLLKYATRETAILWLVIASLFFYGYWNVNYLLLLAGSILVNYFLGKQISNSNGRFSRKAALLFGISLNLMTLGYFKYANFFVHTINSAFDTSFHLEAIILPLAISFFTFQQIAFLVDAYYSQAREYSFLHYSLFVTFFPQLIAGPIVHHKEMMPQFDSLERNGISSEKFAVGMSIFIIGLFKKVLIADTFAIYASRMFDAAVTTQMGFFDSWTGVFAYAFQIYFDFSAYSDMAIGIALMFCIRLPLNFYSPYRATSIIDFWRTWHITLSRFLRDYLYIPLGGNRKGKARRYINLMLTMLLGGLWHGAGWTFVIWGGLHGIYLVINHAWRRLKKPAKQDKKNHLLTVFYRLLTFLAVCVAWVFFRADSTDTAFTLLQSMFLVNGFEYQETSYFKGAGDLIIVILTLLYIWYMPNTYELFARYKTALLQNIDVRQHVIAWRPSTGWLVLLTITFVVAILNLSRVSEFIYFQF